jgi:NAD-dependent SIR2 family protein deacetylase
VRRLITQNVDRLHQRAGSEGVIDLHGRLDRVVCLGCGAVTARTALQARLIEANPGFAGLAAAAAPDGDARVEDVDFGAFRVPGCEACGGILKPDVVFFGEAVPGERVEEARSALLGADALLVAGSSLMVYSGFRFCRLAHEHALPVAAVNLGRTRADDLLDLKVQADCATALSALAEAVAADA